MKNSNEKTVFKLFISGMSVKSLRAIENITHLAEHYLTDNYELEIIDLNERREMAAAYQIFALPTLLKLSPDPSRIILGDLSDKKKILQILGIND